ncbi:MAG TPA: Calx-beta domain-containing protein [Thermoanaerobaculia bacterium]|jgi:hypothetical protein|nr:Calx-beta domain-containing protein [Thermoanaerobaculia bacterium]
MIRRSLLLAISLVLAGTTLHAQQPVVSMAATTYTFHETDGTGAVTINRSGNPSASFSVNYSTRINGVDTTGTVTFGPSELSKVLALPIHNDHAYQSWASELQGFIVLNPTTGVTLGAVPSATINIIEAEPRPQVTLASTAVAEGNRGTTDVVMTVTLSGPFSENAEFYASVSGGTATFGSDYQGGYP